MPGHPLTIVKMHGAANDYVYVDCFTEPVPADPAGIAPRISDRHRGVGGDGLVLVEPSDRADARMRMFNADGSEDEMCGNAVRCVDHMLVARGRAEEGPVTIETGRGVLALELTRTGPRASRVRVDMGAPILAAAEIPVAVPGDRVVDVACPALGPEQPWWRACGLDPRMTCVSMGNPHLVLFCRDVAAVPLEAVGPGLETHAIFPRRINVHVVEVLGPAHVRMRTWERGSGVTMACGTGAAAVCVAGALSGRTGRTVAADLPGGRLDLEWSPSGHVFMTGPAEEVFTGTWWDG